MKRSPKSFFYTALFLILTILSLGAWYYIHLPTVLPIHNVKVIGNYQYVTQEQLRNAVLPDVARGFFNVNVLHSEQALVALPGVASASVRRIWPDAVSVVVIEKKPLARLKDGSLYAKDGTVFVPFQHVASDADLPLFEASSQDLAQVQAMYEQSVALLWPDELVPTRVSYSNLGDWEIQVDQGFVMKLGNVDALSKLKKFAAEYRILIQLQPNQYFDYVDMRYPSGFAIHWLSKPNSKKA